MFLFFQKFYQAASQPQHHSHAFRNHLLVFVMPRGWGVHFLLRVDQRHLRWKISISGLGSNHCHDQPPPRRHELLAQLCHLLQGKLQGIDNKQWMLFLLTTLWVLRTPNTGQNMIINVFWAKRLKKERKSKKFDAKFSFLYKKHQASILVQTKKNIEKAYFHQR